MIGFAASTLYEDEVDLVVGAVRRALGAPVPVGVG